MGETQLRLSKFEHLSFSEKGMRDVNEDSVFSYESEELSLYMVADGIGGDRNGDQAAACAIETVSDHLCRHLSENVEEEIRLSFENADRMIKSSVLDAGTTLAGLLIAGEVTFAFWTGDVRVIVSTEPSLFSSNDHTLYNVLKENNLVIKAEEVMRMKNTLTRSIGGKSNSFLPEITTFKTNEIKSAIVCSDGVHHHQNGELLIINNSKSATDMIAHLKGMGESSKDNYSAIYLWNSNDSDRVKLTQ